MNANPALRTSRAGSSAIVAELKRREGSALCASSIAQSKMSRIMQAGPADALGCLVAVSAFRRNRLTEHYG